MLIIAYLIRLLKLREDGPYQRHTGFFLVQEINARTADDSPRGARPHRQAKAGMSERTNMKLNQKVAWRHKGGFCIGVIVGAIYSGVTTYVVLVGDKLHETAQDDLLPSFA
jgi:hypothetical protein